eukprot:gene5041-3630_t
MGFMHYNDDALKAVVSFACNHLSLSAFFLSRFGRQKNRAPLTERNCIGEFDAMDDVDKYLQRVKQIQKAKFGTSGFVSVAHENRSGNAQLAVGSPSHKRQRDTENSSGETLMRRSLIDKWFPGNVLKVPTIALKDSPPSSYVDITIQRITSARERMLFLRGGVEDMEKTLEDMNDDAESSSKVPGRNEKKRLKALGEVLNQFAVQVSPNCIKVDKQVRKYQLIKESLGVPLQTDAMKWHSFLNANGPETTGLPLTSYFLFPSSASITLLYTIISQRLLNKLKAMKKDRESDERDGSDIEGRTEEQKRTAEGDEKLLSFLQLFMPTKSSDTTDGRCISGYCSWILACLAVLDTPLDPDTDRLTSSLFHICCDQVRAIGKKQATGDDHKGALLSVLPISPNPIGAKSYKSIQDVGREEVLALYSVIIILSKIFRQNQNQMIPL